MPFSMIPLRKDIIVYLFYCDYLQNMKSPRDRTLSPWASLPASILLMNLLQKQNVKLSTEILKFILQNLYSI